jgi:hypothetical protein
MTAGAAVSSITIRCPRCRRDIDIASLATPVATCPRCSRSFEATRFEPQSRITSPQSIEGALAASQPCAVHALNAAVTSCERCGAFMCALCRIDVDGRTLCPTCFERLSTEGSLKSTQTSFRDYSGLAGVTATAGVLLWFLGLLFGPLAIYYASKGLKQKKAMDESDGKAGLWIAIVVGALEIVGGAFFVVALFLRP